MSDALHQARCNYCRDSGIRWQLAFNASEQLLRIQNDRHPLHVLKLPLTGIEPDLGEVGLR